MAARAQRPPHLALGADGSVFLDVRALTPELRALVRGRRRFVGVQLEGRELVIVRRVMNETGAYNAALLVGQQIARRGQKG